MYKCYTQEKIPGIEANYKHNFKTEITLLNYYLLLVTAKKKRKKQTSRMLYGHIVQDNLSELEIDFFFFFCKNLIRNHF